ncbi:MAG: hypothetical protein R3F38_12960 [Gammaproteobacteria bacterium]
MQKPLATALLVIILACAAYWLFMPRDLPDAASPATPAIRQPTAPSTVDRHPVLQDDTPLIATPTPQTVTPAPVTDDLVPPPATLEGSDSVVLDAVSQLSADVTAWLLPQEQIRKWVVLVNALADGKVPVKGSSAGISSSRFQGAGKRRRLWLDRASTAAPLP